MSTYVLYNDKTVDGYASMIAAYLKLGTYAEYVPIRPRCILTTDVLLNKDTVVYVLGSLLSIDILEQMALAVKDLVLINNDRATPDERETFPQLIDNFDISISLLTWQHFFPRVKEPDIFKYIQDAYTQRYKKEHSEAIALALYVYRNDLNTWLKFVSRWDDYSSQLTVEGKIILRYNKQLEPELIPRYDKNTQRKIKAFLSREFSITLFQGYKIILFNTTYSVHEFGLAVLDKFPEADFSMSYYLPDTGHVLFNLRSKGPVDVGAIARNIEFLGAVGDGTAGIAKFKQSLEFLTTVLKG